MEMTVIEALLLLDLVEPFTIAQLKSAYRKLIQEWHPDTNASPGALEISQRLNVAHALLKKFATEPEETGDSLHDDTTYVNKIIQQWMDVYRETLKGGIDAGLHYFTFLESRRRKNEKLKPEWFRNALFEDSPAARLKYREHLIKIAPHRDMKEIWARHYFLMEFGDGWIFYLPGGRDLLPDKQQNRKSKKQLAAV